MGAKLTGTLVAANLLAVSGLAGLQLYGAVQGLEAERFQPRVAALDSHRQAGTDPAAEGRYPPHPVRVVTRSLDGTAPGPEALAAVAITGADEASPDPATSEQSTLSLPLIAEAKADDSLEVVAEDLGRLTTAAGPAHALRAVRSVGRPSPEEAWRASPRLQVAYSARIPDAVTEVPAEAAPAKPSPRHETAEALLSRVVGVASSTASGYVIIGSYGTRDNATLESEEFAHWQPKIMSTVVDGKTYFRVAVGPFAKTDLNRALKAVIADGGKRAWPLVPKRAKQAAAKQ